MKIRTIILGLLAAGCEPEPRRAIPDWDDTDVEGDCVDDPLYAEPYGAGGYTLLWSEDLAHPDGSLPSGYGRVITVAVEFGELLRELGLEAKDWPIVDFETHQVGVVWLEGCGTEIESAEVLRKADASLVFDVDLVDEGKSCDVACDGLTQALVMNSFTNESTATVCRRVHSGCAR